MLRNPNSLGVIVLGGHVQAYGIVKIFGKNKIYSVVIDSTKKNIARHSKYCVKYYQVNYDDIFDFLLSEEFKNKFRNWLLIPTDDYYVRILSQNIAKLNDFYKVSVDEWDKIKLFFNKRYSYPLAKSCKIPIPKTYYPNDQNDLENLTSEIDFPCIIKPAVMLDFYRYFKKKVFVCNNSDELRRNYSRAVSIIKNDEIIIQEIIEGGNENQYSVGIFFDRDKSYNYVVGRRKRQHPLFFGNATTFAETVDIPILIEYSHKLLSKAEFFGICEVEFKFNDKTKEYTFLEVNPRTWKWHSITEVAQIPLLLSLFNFFINGSPKIKKDFIVGGWRDLIVDIPIILQMIAKNVYTKSQTSNIDNAVINIKDIKPFLFQIIYLLNFIKKR